MKSALHGLAIIAGLSIAAGAGLSAYYRVFPPNQEPISPALSYVYDNLDSGTENMSFEVRMKFMDALIECDLSKCSDRDVSAMLYKYGFDDTIPE